MLSLFPLLIAHLALAAPDAPQLSKDPADFAHYIDMVTLSAADLHLDTPHHRIMFVGDVHGMRDSFQRLLGKLEYDPAHDLLVHVGDIVAKGPDSPAVLDWFVTRNITGVRGNHDQKVIEWRGWIEWVEKHKGGRKWLDKMERKHPDGLSTKSALKKGKKKPNKAPYAIPAGWTFNGDHYRIARGMSSAHAAYLRALPLTLHLAPLHAFVGHAGLLPMDPTLPPTAPAQPLAHPPHARGSTKARRRAQERAILHEVPQNTEPWNKLNVRSITDDGKVSRGSDDGVPWAELWNSIVDRCDGFDVDGEIHNAGGPRVVGDAALVLNEAAPVLNDAARVLNDAARVQDDTDTEPARLPCHPASVIYGHAASRGLDIRPWTKGLDTGCVYGKRLTAMLLGARHGQSDLVAETVAFGEDAQRARLISVDCSDDVPVAKRIA